MVVPVIFGTYCLAYIVQVHGISWRSTLYPYLLIGLMALLLAIDLARSRAAPQEGAGGNEDSDAQGHGRRLARPVAIVATTLAYVPLAGQLGFVVTTTLLLAFLLRVMGNRNWLAIMAASAGFSLAIFVAMSLYLKISLPSFRFTDLPFGI